jgi:nucleoside-diphosphate-sugar epimerase
MYPEHNQLDPENPNCEESSAYPAAPDSEYGWEKLFSERMFFSFHRNYDLNVRIARFHNIFGPSSEYNSGKEKAPAALCRKVAECSNGGSIDVYGSGEQIRSFMYISDCLDAVEDLMKSDYAEPINIGSDYTISINDLARHIISFSNKNITINNIDVPQIGVVARTSDNELFDRVIGTARQVSLPDGLEKLYRWVDNQVNGFTP